MKDEIPFYDIDEDTRALLCTVLELSLMTSNLQINPKDSSTVADIVFQTASRFGITIELQEAIQEVEQPSMVQSVSISDLPFKITLHDKKAE